MKRKAELIKIGDVIKVANENLSFFERMIKSMFDLKSYSAVIDAPLKKAIIYIVLLGLFVGSLGMVKHLVYYNDVFNDIKTDFYKRVPEFQIVDGALIMGEDESFIRKNMDFEFIIDPNLDSDTVKLQDTSGVYLTKNAVVLKSIFNNDVISYGGYEDGIITKELIIEYLDVFKKVSLLVLIFLGTLVGLFGKIFNSIVVGFIGMLINRANNYNMSFKNIYKIGVHALTFPSIVALFADIFLMNMPFFTIIYFVMVIVYYNKILRILNEE